jgi:hypothetical protein
MEPRNEPFDAAVAEAYAWPAALPAAELRQRLVRLHHERAREEAGGPVRCLRPAYQAPDQPQAALALRTQAAAVTAATTGTGPHAWSTGLAQQMQALRDALQPAARPLSAAQAATCFRRVRPGKGEPLLATRQKDFLATYEGSRAAPCRVAYPEAAAPVLYPALREQELRVSLGVAD